MDDQRQSGPSIELGRLHEEPDPRTEEVGNRPQEHTRNLKKNAFRLYISHALSTGNSRMFEFGAFLFLATIFPETLLFASIYALARSLAVFLLSSWLGGFMDRSNRLAAIRHSISERVFKFYRTPD